MNIHPRFLVAMQALRWFEQFPDSKKYFGATRTRAREIIYEMTAFKLPRGKVLGIPSGSGEELHQWLVDNCMEHLDHDLMDQWIEEAHDNWREQGNAQG